MHNKSLFIILLILIVAVALSNTYGEKENTAGKLSELQLKITGMV